MIHELLGSNSPELIYNIAQEKLKTTNAYVMAAFAARNREHRSRRNHLTQQITGSARAACIEALIVALLADHEREPKRIDL